MENPEYQYWAEFLKSKEYNNEPIEKKEKITNAEKRKSKLLKKDFSKLSIGEKRKYLKAKGWKL